MDAAFDYRPVVPSDRAQQLWYRFCDAIVEAARSKSDFTLGARLPSLVSEAGFNDVGGMGFFGLPYGRNEHWQTINISPEVAKRMDSLAGSEILSAAELDELVELAKGHEVATSIPYGMAWARRPT